MKKETLFYSQAEMEERFLAEFWLFIIIFC